MQDLIFTAASLLCFLVAIAYVTACDHLKAKPKFDLRNEAKQ